MAGWSRSRSAQLASLNSRLWEQALLPIPAACSRTDPSTAFQHRLSGGPCPEPVSPRKASGQGLHRFRSALIIPFSALSNAAKSTPKRDTPCESPLDNLAYQHFSWASLGGFRSSKDDVLAAQQWYVVWSVPEHGLELHDRCRYSHIQNACR